AGLAGRGPHGRTDRFGTDDGRMADPRSVCPEMTVASPTSAGTLKILCCRGRRQSPSIMIVRLPDWAIDTARLAARVDLPSDTFGLVTWMTWWPTPWVLKYRAVRT